MVALTATQVLATILTLATTLILAVNPAHAASRDELYSGEVLTGEEPPAESTLVRQAFIAMLVKLTGDRQPTRYEAVAGGLSDAARMAARFGFVNFDPPVEIREQLLSNDGSVARRLFRANFIPDQVDQWLQRRQIPRWSPDRSPYAVWLVYEQEGERRFIDDPTDPLRWLVQQSADNRGLPLSWPTPLDPTLDVFAYERTLSTVWAGFHEDLPNTGEHMILAAAQPLRDSWRVRWRLLVRGELVTFVSGAADLATALQDGIHQAADQAARRGMIQSHDAGLQPLHLRVRDIQSSSDYGRVLQELQQLSQTEDVVITDAVDDHLEITLYARAGREWLLRALNVNQVLQHQPDSRSGYFSRNRNPAHPAANTIELQLRR